MRNQFLMNLTTQVVFASVLCVLFISSSVAQTSDQFVLFRNVATNNAKENISISPYGANLALALVVPGTKGETESELKSLLGYEGEVDNLATSLKISDYTKEGSPLNTATSLWIQQNYNVLPTFINTAKTNFAAQIEQVDFQTSPNDACNRINNWVNKNTNSKIKKLFDNVESSNRIIAVSAIYFLAEWKKAFNKKHTHEDNFTLTNGTTKTIQMMRNKKVNLNYSQGLDSQWVELPYKNKGFNAIVILPDKGINPSDVISKLTPDNFVKTLKTLKMQTLDVKLPRFEVEYSTSLKSALSSSGVKKIFSNEADLTGITPSRELVVSDVIQKVYIKVDEAGTEAAAATAVGVRITSIDISPPPIEFYVDRPFIFIVHEGNNILFISKISKP